MLNWNSNEKMTTWGFLVLRVIVGLVFFMHGWQKLTMMGFDGVAGFFGSIGIPLAYPAAILVTFVELVGGAALIAGVFTRYTALLTGATMAVAILTVHLPNGFFVNEGGVELALTLLAASAFYALAGPGVLSVDAKLFGASRRVERKDGMIGAAAD